MVPVGLRGGGVLTAGLAKEAGLHTRTCSLHFHLEAPVPILPLPDHHPGELSFSLRASVSPLCSRVPPSEYACDTCPAITATAVLATNSKPSGKPSLTHKNSRLAGGSGSTALLLLNSPNTQAKHKSTQLGGGAAAPEGRQDPVH